jgi:hypothetical protein
MLGKFNNGRFADWRFSQTVAAFVGSDSERKLL